MRTSSLLALFLLSLTSLAQKPKQPVSLSDRTLPKIVVGVVVDQMRNDYIDRFWNDFSEGGFKRLVREGAYARNVQYNYMPTYTGPGHAAIYTGSTPAYNGIVANDWYVKATGKLTYCASDSTVNGVGTNSAMGKMSPHYLIATTIGDELKMATGNRSKVIGVSLKDRGSILPAGRTANAAYWFMGGTEGVWGSSTWYMDQLPIWVKEFNGKGLPNTYLKQTWNLLKPLENYTESIDDNNPYEIPFKGTIRPTFPYNLDSLKKLNLEYELLKATPQGNTLTLDFALAALEYELLGKGSVTDMLCLSFSATDYVGHQFGTHSKELQDIYLRLDLEIARLLNELDKRFGKSNYLLFLSADHGGTPTPNYMIKQHGSAGYWNSDNFEAAAEEYLISLYGEGNWILNEMNQNIFLNRALIRERKLSLFDVQEKLAQWTVEQDKVFQAYTSTALAKGNQTDFFAKKVALGYSAASGDVIYILKPDYIEYSNQGTTHGSPFAYDSQVPFIMFGKYVQPQTNFEPHNITDIAPTICSYLRIAYPSACIGSPILPFLEQKSK